MKTPIFLFVAAIFVSMTNSAQAGIIYKAGFTGPSSSPQIYQAESPTFEAGQGRKLFASADRLALRAQAIVRRDSIDNFDARMAVDDLIFSSDNPGQTSTTATLRVRFAGLARETQFANWSPNATLAFAGGNVRTFMKAPDSQIDNILDVTMTIPLEQQIAASAVMEMRIGGPVGGPPFANWFGELDFLDSLSFFADQVFLLEPGVTVNSASWGLVNNRLIPPPIISVAEPSHLALLGLLALMSLRHGKQWGRKQWGRSKVPG